MSDWWYVIAVVIVVAVTLLYLRARSNRASRSPEDRPVGARPPRDFPQEREDARVAHMSEEDRTWQAASLQRQRETDERDQTS